MAEKYTQFTSIPEEKFFFVNTSEHLADHTLEDKPIGYFHDAWIRFRKSKAAVAATIIILMIILYAFLAPLLITGHSSTFMDNMYAKKPPRVASLRQYGLLDGGVNRAFSDKSLVRAVAVGIGAEDWAGQGVSLEEGLASEYQPMISIGEPTVVGAGKKKSNSYASRIDAYLEVGFIYRSVTADEFARIQQWEQETGKRILYPLVEDNRWNFDPLDANYWYKSNKGTPIRLDENGKRQELSYGEGMMLEDNYKRGENGEPIYSEYVGGGNAETAQLKIRVLYYNYYQYLYGSTPDYIMGTDSQGYDLALRIAGGIKLSLMISVFVCIINFIIGSVYGALEGYYGGTVDITLQRLSDILYNVPFIVVATLFQIHLSTKLGPLPCLLFAYVLTGWIMTANRVRTQFYRFKGQEYVMAARTLGARDSRIIWKHIYPNSLGTIITYAALSIPMTMLSESNLSFLGIVKLGTAEATSLGTLLADANGIWTNFPHLMFYPAIVISLLMICFNLFGNGLRDAFNPALRGVED